MMNAVTKTHYLAVMVEGTLPSYNWNLDLEN